MIGLDLYLIFITAFVVGLSGAMMPGPVTAVVADMSMRRGFSAVPLVTLGHAVPEVIVVVLLVAGLGRYMEAGPVAGFFGIGGGLILAWMGYGMINGAFSGKTAVENAAAEGRQNRGNPFAAGMLTTLSNPYWFIWWATIGAGYVVFALDYGTTGLIFFFTGHILSDLAWLSLLGVVFVSGKKLITDRIYAWIIGGLGIFLLGFAVYFFRAGINFLTG